MSPKSCSPGCSGCARLATDAERISRRGRAGEEQELLDLVRWRCRRGCRHTARGRRTSPAARCSLSRVRPEPDGVDHLPDGAAPHQLPAATVERSRSARSSRPRRCARSPPARAGSRRAAPRWSCRACRSSRPCRPASPGARSRRARRGSPAVRTSWIAGSSRIARSSATRFACGYVLANGAARSSSVAIERRQLGAFAQQAVDLAVDMIVVDADGGEVDGFRHGTSAFHTGRARCLR